MQFVSGEEKLRVLNYINAAAEVALKAECERSKCGAVIVKDGSIIGYGFNSPPKGSKKRCHIKKNQINQKVTDKTCCIHAEERAVKDALIRNPERIEGSRLYFIRLNQENEIKKAKQPYCTICSKLVLDAGVKEFVLWHEEGICIYDTLEYNELSFNYSE
jgi:deoxycytidylate deaminase